MLEKCRNKNNNNNHKDNNNSGNPMTSRRTDGGKMLQNGVTVRLNLILFLKRLNLNFTKNLPS